MSAFYNHKCIGCELSVGLRRQNMTGKDVRSLNVLNLVELARTMYDNTRHWSDSWSKKRRKSEYGNDIASFLVFSDVTYDAAANLHAVSRERLVLR